MQKTTKILKRHLTRKTDAVKITANRKLGGQVGSPSNFKIHSTHICKFQVIARILFDCFNQAAYYLSLTILSKNNPC